MQLSTRRCPSRLSYFLMPVVLAAGLVAQQFVDTRRSATSFALGFTRALLPVDIDRDGFVDVVVTQSGYGFHRDPAGVLRNTGAGRFTVWQLPTQGTEVHVAGDFDADGDVDLLVTGGMLVNDGRGGLTVGPPQVIGEGVAGDLDRDGRIDIVAGSGWYRNLGQFAFSAVVRIPGAPWVTRPKLIDVDGDGDLDVFYPAGPKLYRNDGRGGLTDVTSTAIPGSIPSGVDCAVIDFDGDGDLDVVLAAARPALLVNVGGNFTDGSTVFANVPPGEVRSIAAGDVDGDRDVDVVLGESGGGRVLINLGAGFLATSGRWDAAGAAVDSLLLLDVDNDRDLDIFAGRSGVENDVAYNDGRGQFVRAGVSPIPMVLRAGDAAAGDLDGDGVPDVLLTEGPGSLLRGTGYGDMEPPVDLGLAVSGTPYLGDVDGDGDLDAVVLQANAMHVLINPGDGRMRGAGPSYGFGLTGTSIATSAVPGDLNGDGKLDVYVTTLQMALPNQPELDQVWLGDGLGGFRRDPSQTIPSTVTRRGVAGDLDGDNDLDLVLDSGVVVRNDSSGGILKLATSTTSMYHFGRAALALGDLDGDGDLDLVCGNACVEFGCWPHGDSPPNTVHWNDGRGAFQGGFLAGTDYTKTWTTDLADVDEDGDLDILFGNIAGNSPENIWCRNDGQRSFPLQPAVPDWDDTLLSFLLDVDRDGDLDWIAIDAQYASTSSRRSKVFANTQRQVHAPHLPRLGQPFVIQVFGPTRGGVLVAAARPAQVRTPLGWLGIDLTTSVIVATFAPGAPRRELSLPLPAQASLAGSVVYLQALVDRNGTLRLTNTLREFLLPH